ncbi:phosphate system positive regulatory protein pho81 [Coemansia sp. RSA 1285]|nr:phosphate system positive regulatory protein pho81 [Coemansia sp. RSA 1285]
MKFGKHIQAHTIPEWAAHYMNYKGLKKIINELSAPLTLGLNPSEVKAAFFFQVDRELEKVNLFYLQKEADAKIRLKSLVEKQRALRLRGPRNRTATIRALREAFLNSRHDLDKLHNFVEINGTGFRKILKKWDKRSKSSTKELYLARQVEVQPCFNQEVIAELSDAVTKCLSELEHALEAEEMDSVSSVAIPTDIDLISSSLQEKPEEIGMLHSLHKQVQPQAAMDTTDIVSDSVSTHTEKLPSFGMRRSSTGFLFDPSLTSSFQIDRIEAELFQALLKNTLQTASELLDSFKTQQSSVQKACVTRTLWRACSEIKAPEKQSLLLASGLADLQSTDDINERTLVHEAAIHGSLTVLQAAVDAGCDANRPDYYGRRPLHYAAINGHDNCIEYLLGLGCETSAIDDDGNSPLEYAVINSNVGATKLLLQADTQVVKDSTDHPVLELACEKGCEDIVHLLLEAGAEMIANMQGVHPIHVAARSGYVGILRLLLNHGAPVDVVDKDLGWTPAFYAASEGHADIVRILIEAGANVSAVDEVGHTPAYYASYEGHSTCANIIFSAGGKLTESSESGVASSAAKLNQDVESNMMLEANTDTSYSSGHGVDRSGSGQHKTTIGASIDPNTAAPAPSGDLEEADLDGIPSLSLPPPLIPFRVYGHNYLGKRTRIQIRIRADSRTGDSPISFFDNRDTFSLKLVAVAKPDTGMVPHTIMLPLETQTTTFGFLTDDPSQFRIEFMLFPGFGLQPIGKAVALPSLFISASRNIARLPFLDRYLKLVAEINFEYLVIRPFADAQLQIGGRVETYWKSTNPGPRSNSTATVSASTGAIGFATQSPKAPFTTGISSTPLSAAAIGSPVSVAESVGGNQGMSPAPLVISSSLAAEHICIQVQVCEDGVSIVAPRLQLSTCGPNSLEVRVTNLTHAEFQNIIRAKQSNSQGSSAASTIDSCPPSLHSFGADTRPDFTTGTAAEWHRYVTDNGFTLKEVFEILPIRFGLSIQM